MLVRYANWIRRAALGAGLLAILGCGEEEKDTITAPTNQPPTFLLTGPAYPARTLDAGVDRLPEFFAIVGDPNGLKDIAGVVLACESVRVHRVIARPVDFAGSCATPHYAADDTIAITA